LHATASSEHVMAADPSHPGIFEEGGSWDLVRGRLRQAKELHSFCEPHTPRTLERDRALKFSYHRRTVSTWDIGTEIDDAPLAETKHWDLVSQSLRVCGYFAKGDRDVRFTRGHKKKRSRWDKVRHHHGRHGAVHLRGDINKHDLESTPLQSPRTISSASTEAAGGEEAKVDGDGKLRRKWTPLLRSIAVVVESSRKQAVQGLLTLESEDPTAELDASRWKEGWLRRKNGREPGQGGLQKTRSTRAPLAHELGLISISSHGASHIMARCGGSANRPRGLAPHSLEGRSFRARTLSESNAAQGGLTSFYKFVKAKYPHVRASPS